jgi:hypothetical protein
MELTQQPATQNAEFPGEVHPTPGGGIVISSFDALINWARSNSLWPLTFATSCCGIEMMSTASSKYDFSRFRFRSGQGHAPAGRRDHHRRNDREQDGAGVKTPLRPDGRSQIRDRHGRMRHQWRTVLLQHLFCGERRRPYHPGRCLYTRMPAKTGSAATCFDHFTG